MLKKLLKKDDRGGFTLIELLVAMAVIAILVTLVIYAINATRMQQRNTQRRSTVNAAKAALEAYYSTYKNYPNTLGTGTVSQLITTPPAAGVSTYLTGITANQTDDPSGTNNRMCYARTNNNSYVMYVQPEPAAAVGCAGAVPIGAEDFSVR